MRIYERVSANGRESGALNSSRFTCPDDGGDTFLRNVGYNQKYTAQHPRRRFPAYAHMFYFSLLTGSFPAIVETPRRFNTPSK
jgi:hypothetical protein